VSIVPHFPTLTFELQDRGQLSAVLKLSWNELRMSSFTGRPIIFKGAEVRWDSRGRH